MLNLDGPKTLGQLVEEAAAAIADQLTALGADAGLLPRPRLEGPPETEVSSLASADESGPGALTFAVAPNYLEKARTAGAAAVIVPPALAQGGAPGLPLVITPEPRLVFAVLLGLMGESSRPKPTAGEAFFVDRSSVSLGRDVIIGPQAYIGRGATIGDRTVIGPQAYVGDGVSLGRDCVVHPRAMLHWGTRVGDRCQIHSGTVIGEDGFGYTQLPDPAHGRLLHYKNEHLGGVILEDDVEIGVNSAIDRGLVSDTVIGRGTKIDNQVQIGHNVRVGRDCILVSQVGVAGHSVLGDRVFLLGQTGLGPGVVLGDDLILGSGGGVSSGSLPAGRRVWGGIPARPIEEVHQMQALSFSQLPKLRKFFQLLKKCDSLADLKAAFFAPEPKPDKEKK